MLAVSDEQNKISARIAVARSGRHFLKFTTYSFEYVERLCVLFLLSLISFLDVFGTLQNAHTVKSENTSTICIRVHMSAVRATRFSHIMIVTMSVGVCSKYMNDEIKLINLIESINVYSQQHVI